MVPEPDVESVPVILPGVDTAVYEVMVEPPSLLDAVYVTLADVAPVTVAVPIVGAVGTFAVVILLEAALDVPVPTELVALTEKVYDVFADRPVTLIGEEEPVPVIPPGLDVAV
jgi:hypothetical protein